MKINHFTLYFFLVFSSVYLSACSDTPSVTQLQDGVRETVEKQEYKSIFMIRNIKKINGYMLDNFYFAVMKYDRLCLLDINDAISMLDNDIQTKKSNSLFDDLNKGLHNLARQSGLLKTGLVDQFGEFKKGDILKEKLTIKFLKTEQGWRLYKEHSK